MPGFFADDDEYRALLDVLARHPGRTFQVITRFNDPEHDIADAERFARLCRRGGVRGQWPGIPTDVLDADHASPALRTLHRPAARRGGGDFWPIVAFKPLEPFFGFERSIVFQRVPAWNDMVNGPAEDEAGDARRSGVARPGPPRLGRPSEVDHGSRRPPARA